MVGSGGGEAFALDAKSGAVLWRRPTGGIPLLGAGDDGAVTVVTFRKAGGAGSVLLAVAHDGQVVRQIETEKPLGLARGARAARVRARGPGSTCRSSTSRTATRPRARRCASRRAGPGRRPDRSGSGRWGTSASTITSRTPRKGKATTHHRARRASCRERRSSCRSGDKRCRPWPTRPTRCTSTRDRARTDSGASIEDDRWYATYFRLAMGFGADKGKLAWVHLHGADFVGGAAAAGRGRALRRAGQGRRARREDRRRARARWTSASRSKSCVVNVDAQRIAGTPEQVKPLAAAALGGGEGRRSAARQRAEAAPSRARRPWRTTARRGRSSTSRAIRGRARTSSATRARRSRTGATGRRYMEAALARHYDFLKDVLASAARGSDRAGARRDEGEGRGAAARVAPARHGGHGRRREAGGRGARRRRGAGPAADAPPVLRDVPRERAERRHRERRRERRPGAARARRRAARWRRGEGRDDGAVRARAARGARRIERRRGARAGERTHKKKK